MRGLSSRLSFGNVAAALALFLALGGAAYAGSKIGTGDLKDEAVTNEKIEKRTIKGNRIASNTIEGKKIDEATLGQVPDAANATNATDAQTLQGNGPASFVPETSQRRFNTTLAFGEDKTLFSAGTLTVTARCRQNATDNNGLANRDFLQLLIATNQNGAVFEGDDNKDGSNAADFLNTDTPEADRVLEEFSLPTGTSEFTNNGDFGARDPNGVNLFTSDDGIQYMLNLFGANCSVAGLTTVVP